MPPRMVPAHPPGQLQIVLEERAPVLHVRLRGELDLATADQLRACREPEGRSVSTVLLDLAHLCFCDFTGLRALLDFRSAHMEQRRTVTVSGLSPNVRHLLESAGVLGLLLP